MDELTEMLKGSLEGCVLEIINRGETYGYEITQTLRNLGFKDIVEGTVYTILIRLEKKEWVTTEKKKSVQGPPRKFYQLTPLGKAELELFWKKWQFVTEKIEQLKEFKK